MLDLLCNGLHQFTHHHLYYADTPQVLHGRVNWAYLRGPARIPHHHLILDAPSIQAHFPVSFVLLIVFLDLINYFFWPS